jgi:hypothetical protein
MHSLKGPLLVIAAAIIWNGSATFHSGGKRDYDGWAAGGTVVAGVVLLIGLRLTCSGRSEK